jgi:hypothetical protein
MESQASIIPLFVVIILTSDKSKNIICYCLIQFWVSKVSCSNVRFSAPPMYWPFKLQWLLYVFYFWVPHPVACINKVIRSAGPFRTFFKMFIHIYLLLLHVSALVGHPQVEYTISCWKLMHLQWIRCSACFMHCWVTIYNIFGKSWTCASARVWGGGWGLSCGLKYCC